jgi:hypothetical protein
MVKESSWASSLLRVGGDSVGHVCTAFEPPGEPALHVAAGGVDCWDPDGVTDARVSDACGYTQGVPLREQ